MVYEDICNFGMDQLVITQYKKILKILQENSNILILKMSYISLLISMDMYDIFVLLSSF